MQKKVSAIILAAGKGTRMQSDLPKVLHQAAGRSLLAWTISAAEKAGMEQICLVVGHGADSVRTATGEGYLYALQEPQLGTGHAVQCGLNAFAHLPEHVLVLCGDTPLLRAETLLSLVESYFAGQAACAVLTTVLTDAGSYGRILRGKDGSVEGIVETSDASPEQLQIGEINSGVYCFQTAALAKALLQLKPNNKQGEYYLTDVLALLHAAGERIIAFICDDPDEIQGVNTRAQLVEADRILQTRGNPIR